MPGAHVDGLGTVAIRAIDVDHPRPTSPSQYEQWGEIAPEAAQLPLERWLIELTVPDGPAVVVGDLSAHPIWYGPSPGSRALNIGISIVEEYRGRGIGTLAQGLLADELHARGVVRVEASTDVDNTAEQRALELAGFTFEGILRSAQARSDGRHDLQVWSHLGSLGGGER